MSDLTPLELLYSSADGRALSLPEPLARLYGPLSVPTAAGRASINGAAVSPTPQPFEPAGPGAPFELLFAEHTDGQVSLPKSWQRIYGSDWRLPPATDRPHVFVLRCVRST